jgi:hypothetical protein
MNKTQKNICLHGPDVNEREEERDKNVRKMIQSVLHGDKARKLGSLPVLNDMILEGFTGKNLEVNGNNSQF